MSYLSLYQQLSIEFLSDPEFHDPSARDETYALWARWRQTIGRHTEIDLASDEFGRWWRNHYEDSLRHAGRPRSYRRFIECLAGKIPDYGRRLNQ